MSQKLSGKVAIVTGSATGIGAAIARALSAEGASVVVNYNTNQVGAESVVAEIKKAGGNAVAVGADTTKRASAQAIVDAAIKNFGQLDILVNNTGVHESAPVQDVDEELFRHVFETNVLSTMLVTSAALSHLNAGSSIINVGSVTTHYALLESSIYTASKAAIDGYTTIAANELGPRGIRVNTLKPGLTATERSIANGIPDSDWAKGFTSRTPLGRLGTPDEIAKAAVFLASDDSAFVTGVHLLVAGGLR